MYIKSDCLQVCLTVITNVVLDKKYFAQFLKMTYSATYVDSKVTINSKFFFV